MIPDNSLIFFYHRLNCYSFNALAGAIDSDPGLAELAIARATTADAVLARAADAVKRYHRAIVALSIMTCQMEEMRRLIGHIRLNCGSKITVLAGGPHVTACPEEVLAAGADVAFRGEAELSFPAVLKSIAEEREIRGVQSSPDTVCLDSFPVHFAQEGHVRTDRNHSWLRLRL